MRPATVGTPDQWHDWNVATKTCGNGLVTETLTRAEYPGTDDGWDYLLACDERIRVNRAKKLPPRRVLEESPRTSIPARYRTDPPKWLADSKQFDDAVAWASDWLRTRDRVGLLIAGSIGVGKTGIATYIARLCGEPNHATYWPVRDLLAALKADFDTDRGTLGFVKNKPLVVLDDIGTERPTEFARETLAEIIEARFNAGLATVVTTNLHQDASRSGSLQEHLGVRAYSRLVESTRELIVVGADRRLVTT